MELAKVTNEKGTILFSRITLETLVYLTLLEIPGISIHKKNSLRRFTNRIIKSGDEDNQQTSQDIRIDIKPNAIIVNLFLIIHYGLRIPDLTWEIQAKVKEKIKEQAELEVQKINIHIQGIRYPKKIRKNNQLVSPEIFVKIF